LSSTLESLEAQIICQRAEIRTRLLATCALERQWIQRQTDLDLALAVLSPASLYNNLTRALQEQIRRCQIKEDDFLEIRSGRVSEDVITSEKEILEWIRDYRESRIIGYMRREQKDRWDEGRVGGWP